MSLNSRTWPAYERSGRKIAKNDYSLKGRRRIPKEDYSRHGRLFIEKEDYSLRWKDHLKAPERAEKKYSHLLKGIIKNPNISWDWMHSWSIWVELEFLHNQDNIFEDIDSIKDDVENQVAKLLMGISWNWKISQNTFDSDPNNMAMRTVNWRHESTLHERKKGLVSNHKVNVWYEIIDFRGIHLSSNELAKSASELMVQCISECVLNTLKTAHTKETDNPVTLATTWWAEKNWKTTYLGNTDTYQWRGNKNFLNGQYARSYEEREQEILELQQQNTQAALDFDNMFKSGDTILDDNL